MIVGSTRAAIFTTKILLFALSAATKNSFLSMISTLLVVGKTSAAV